MVCLVCTGGIGSGKSYALRVITRLGIPSYIADNRAKELYYTDKVLLRELKELLGDEIAPEGVIRREIMAAKIFPNPELLTKVNEIVHPRVLADFEAWKIARGEDGADIVVFESAIFFESPVFHHIADKVMVVTAPEEVRIQRVIKRDKVSRELVTERIQRQCSEKERLERADFIVYTDGKRAVLPQILQVLNQMNIKR
ncbi:MAG TPA: dephospho-CoA kinase [Rikenellaceae bacterium]|nr:MAG: dephospho-CoA kinase [Bacteroidetes bacterium GWE2_40_15]HBZ25939.1 dephospho-CoA kinase [Rikenellaceae bacterium]